MSTGKRRVFSREFKVSAVKRMLAGEHVASLASELQITSAQLSKWCWHFRRGGPARTATGLSASQSLWRAGA